MNPKIPLKILIAVLCFSMFNTFAQADSKLEKMVDLPTLIRVLDSPYAKVRRYATKKLAKMGPRAAPAVSKLLKALDDKDLFVRIGATRALGKIGPKSVPGLRRTLKHPKPRVRRAVCDALAEIGTKSLPALGDLITLLGKDTSRDVRTGAAKAIGNMGALAAKAVPTLIKSLKDKELPVRSFSVVALGKIGPKAKKAVLPLCKAFKAKGEWPLVRRYIIVAIGKIKSKPTAAIPLLVSALKNDKTVSEAAIAIGRFGAFASNTAGALLKALKKQAFNKDWGPRYSIYKALGQIGPSAKIAIPTLKKMLVREKKSFLRNRITKVIKQINDY